jgi:hypothetical protein
MQFPQLVLEDWRLHRDETTAASSLPCHKNIQLQVKDVG